MIVATARQISKNIRLCIRFSFHTGCCRQPARYPSAPPGKQRQDTNSQTHIEYVANRVKGVTVSRPKSTVIHTGNDTPENARQPIEDSPFSVHLLYNESPADYNNPKFFRISPDFILPAATPAARKRTAPGSAARAKARKCLISSDFSDTYLSTPSFARFVALPRVIR
ncbi:MAG: hypothetical protein ACLQGV_18510 [Bryobacteraceae bacterium]